MLKLTADLFRVNPLAKYADYYERALYNHILSTQHPDHGGYVYFTPARPRHYRVYSAPNQAMWCCVGTGMENHGKYGEFIYTRNTDTLFLNLFIASELNWDEKGVSITQETNFPYEEKTQLTVHTSLPVAFKLIVRHPYWVSADTFKIVVGIDTLTTSSEPSSYVLIDRTWNDGDVVSVILPMANRIEKLINVPGYAAFMHGPILLAAKSGTEDLAGLIADAGRWGHIAHGSMLPIYEAPIIVEDDLLSIADSIVAVEGKDNIRVKFKASASGYAGGAFYIRLLRQEATSAIEKNIKNAVGAIIWGSEKMILISGLKDKALVNIFDLSGRLIKSGSFKSQNVNIPISPGIYPVNIVTGNNDIINREVVVN